jgi:hypothetical protein
MTDPYHPHPFGTPCVPECVTPVPTPELHITQTTSTSGDPTPPVTFRDEPTEMRLLREVAERVQRKHGRLTMTFYDGWWRARLSFYDEDDRWHLATGLGKILTEALMECLADAAWKETN